MSGFSFMSEERDSDIDDPSRPTVSGFGFISGGRSESENSEGGGGFLSSLSAEELAELKKQAEEVSNEEVGERLSEDGNRQSVSGFSFMSNASSSSHNPTMSNIQEEDDDVEESGRLSEDDSRQSVSGFSFMGNTSASHNPTMSNIQEEDDDVEESGRLSEDDSRQSVSGFGFMSSSSSATTTPIDRMGEIKEEEEVEDVQSIDNSRDLSEEIKKESVSTTPSIDLLSQVDNSFTSSSPLASQTNPQQTQEIKLASSSTKVTRKKKRTSKVGSQRNLDVEEPSAQKLPVINETPPPTPPSVVTTPKVENTPPPVATKPIGSSSLLLSTSPVRTSSSSSPSPVKSTNTQPTVVHLSDKPPITPSPSNKSVSEKTEVMSDISEDNSSVGSSSKSVSSDKKKKKKSFMSYFSKKKEVVEVTKPPESSNPYKPHPRGNSTIKNLAVQQPVSTTIKEEHHDNVHIDGYSFEPHHEGTSDDDLSPKHMEPVPPIHDTLPTSEGTSHASRENVWKMPGGSSSSPKKTEVSTGVKDNANETSPKKESTNHINIDELVEETVIEAPKGPKSILVQDDSLCIKIKELSREVVLNFQTSVNDIASYQSTLLQEMRDHQSRKDRAESSSQRILQSIQEVETEQGKLAEAEEFEQADALSDKLEALREEYAKCVEQDKSSIKSYEEAEASFAECRRELSNKMNETAHGLGNLIRQQVEELNNVVSANSKALTEEDSRVAAEEERIFIEMNHVEREQSTLSEETETIEKTIASQTVDVQKDKDEMDLELLGVSAEVQRLEEELALKKQEQKMLEMNLLVAEGKIREVRRKYDRQLQRISDRSMTVRAAREECQQEHDAINLEREHFMEEKQKLNDIEVDITEFIKNMERERDTANSLRETFDSVLMAAPKNPSSSDESDSESKSHVSAIREKVVAQETALQKAISTLESTRSTISTLGEEDSQLKEDIPLKETEKKSHASNKRFKEAGAVAKEIKSMVSRRDEIASIVLEKEGMIAGMEAVIQKSKQSLDAVQSELIAAERIVDLARFEDLQKQAVSLRLACRSSEKEKDKSGSNDIIAVVAYDLLSAELKVLLDEAAEIKSKHDLEADLLPPLVEESDEENESNPVMSEDGVDKTESNDKSDSDGGGSGDDGDCNKENDNTDEDVVDDDGGDKCNKRDEDDVANASEEVPEKENTVEVIQGEKKNLISVAKALFLSIKSLEADLEVAVDEEEYDDAATISEQVDDLTAKLDEMLSTLGISRQELDDCEENDA